MNVDFAKIDFKVSFSKIDFKVDSIKIDFGRIDFTLLTVFFFYFDNFLNFPKM